MFVLHNCERIFTRFITSNIVKRTSLKSGNFNNTFFPHFSQERNNLCNDIKSLPLPISFKKSLLHFVKISKNFVFAVSNSNGIKLLNRLTLNFTHLKKHKFRHNSLQTINTMCNGSSGPETTA